jgi:hypothetical protein
MCSQQTRSMIHYHSHSRNTADIAYWIRDHVRKVQWTHRCEERESASAVAVNGLLCSSSVNAVKRLSCYSASIASSWSLMIDNGWALLIPRHLRSSRVYEPFRDTRVPRRFARRQSPSRQFTSTMSPSQRLSAMREMPANSILEVGMAIPKRRTSAAVSIAHARQPQTRAMCSPTIYATYAQKQTAAIWRKKKRP